MSATYLHYDFVCAVSYVVLCQTVVTHCTQIHACIKHANLIKTNKLLV